MKKVILLVSALSLLAIGFSSVSCKKEWKGCKCTIEAEGVSGTIEVPADKAKEAGFKDCKAVKAAMDEDGVSVTCKDL